VETVISEGAMAYGLQCGTEKHAKQVEVVLDKVAEMHRIRTRVILLAPDALKSPFMDLTHHVAGELLVTSIQCPKVSTEERNAVGNKLSTFMTDFIMTARHDIGIHPLDNFEKTKKPWRRFWA